MGRKISELTQRDIIQGGEDLVLAYNGLNYRTSIDDIAAYTNDQVYHLYGRKYDLTSLTSDISDLSGSIEWDSTGSCYKLSGDITIKLPHLSCYTFTFKSKSIPEKSYLTTSNESYYIGDRVIFHFDDIEGTITVTLNNDCYFEYIFVEETSIPVLTKVSLLENDANYVSATVENELLTLTT